MTNVRTILENFLRKLGGSIARHPCMFTLCPLMLSFLLTTGIQKMKVLKDIESLDAPSTSISIRDRTYLESLFPMNFSSNFYPERRTREGSFASVIIVASDGDSILRSNVLKEIFFLYREIQEITIYWDNRRWNYRHICARNQNVCFQNSVFSFENLSISKDYRKNIDFRLLSDPSLFNTDYSLTGRMFINGENRSTQAKALRMSYYLDDSTESRKHLAYQWENTFIKKFKLQKFSNISIKVLSSRSLDNISWKVLQRTVLYALVMLCSLTFCWLIITSKPNCFRGKPWMGLVIAVSSGLSVASGHGLLMYCELYFTPSTVIAVILILGTTAVDTLAMISVWRETDSKKSVEDRLGQTYSEIGVPIVASFSINFLSLLIGTAFSPFHKFSVFCFYVASCLALGFLYQMTLIGGCMAAFGYAEEKHLHSLIFRPVQITSMKENQLSLCSRSGWQTRDKNQMERITSSPPSRNTIIESIKKIVTCVQTRSFLIVLYLVYVTTSIWGITDIENDYTLKEVISQDSYVNSYFQKLRENFSQYRDKVQLVLNTTLNYADPNVQDKINIMLKTLESSEYGNLQTKFWLRSYLKFLSKKRFAFALQNYNMTDKGDFIHVLRHHFLRYPLGKEFMNDVVFNEGNNEIVASRFFIWSYSSMSERDYWKRLQQIRRISNEKFFPTVVYHPKLFIFEETDISMPTTVVQLCAKALITAIACSVILSSIAQAIIICCSYLSICLGVLGYMALWNVGMNAVSSKYIVCFSSLSLSYLTHSVCAYTTISKKKNYNLCWKVRLVILKGSIISILSVVIVFIRPSWTAPSAFKSAFLTSAFAALQTVCFQTIATSMYDSVNEMFVKWSTTSCSRKRDCRIAGKFRHPTVGGIYNGSVVISHIDLAS